MSKSVLIDGVRTPIGRFRGGLSQHTAKDLGVIVITELLKRLPRDSKINEVILGQVIQAGQGQNPARQVAIRAGINPTTPATTLNNVCIASLASVAEASRRIDRNEGDLYVVGGFESMTNAPHVSNLRKGVKMGPASLYDTLDDGLWCAISDRSMGGVSEEANRELNIDREEQDEYALLSQTRATKAQKNEIFMDEIVGVET
jgi:acetyl-CoA C-acetyltransferase